MGLQTFGRLLKIRFTHDVVALEDTSRLVS